MLRLKKVLLRFKAVWKHRQPRTLGTRKGRLSGRACFQQIMGNGNPMSPTTPSEDDNQIKTHAITNVGFSANKAQTSSHVTQKKIRLLNNTKLGNKKNWLSDDSPGSQHVHRCILVHSARRHLHAHGAPTQMYPPCMLTLGTMTTHASIEGPSFGTVKG
nr:hypothetical protein [Tanacetum cinerariifolium]